MRSRFMRDGCLNDSLCSSFFDYVKRFGHFWRIYSDLFISSKLRVRGLFYSLQRKTHEFKNVMVQPHCRRNCWRVGMVDG